MEGGAVRGPADDNDEGLLALLVEQLRQPSHAEMASGDRRVLGAERHELDRMVLVGDPHGACQLQEQPDFLATVIAVFPDVVSDRHDHPWIPSAWRHRDDVGGTYEVRHGHRVESGDIARLLKVPEDVDGSYLFLLRAGGPVGQLLVELVRVARDGLQVHLCGAGGDDLGARACRRGARSARSGEQRRRNHQSKDLHAAKMPCRLRKPTPLYEERHKIGPVNDAQPERPIAWRVLKKGAPIFASSGDEVGRVSEVVADDQKDIFSGLAFKQGLLSSQRFLPADLIESLTEEGVYLTISESQADQLDPYPG